MGNVRAFIKKHPRACLIAVLVLAVVFPLLGFKKSTIRIFCRILMYVTLAGSLNITNGYSGQTSLGHAGFYCVGAYTVAILTTRYEVSFWPVLLLAGILTALVGLIISIPTLRLKGIYLSIITMGASEVIRIVALNWESLTGGSFGIKGIPRPTIFSFTIDSPIKFYYLFLAVALIFMLVSYRVIHSRVGRSWMSIRENELAAKSLGVETQAAKMTNFIFGAFWAGIVGGIYAVYVQYIDSAVFSLDEGFNIMSMIIIGGQGTLIGPVVGAIVVNGLTEILRPIGVWRFVMYAALIIAMMWFRPQGLMGESNSILAGGKITVKKEKKSPRKEAKA